MNKLCTDDLSLVCLYVEFLRCDVYWYKSAVFHSSVSLLSYFYHLIICPKIDQNYILAKLLDVSPLVNTLIHLQI